MPTIAEIRAQFPQYSDLSDEDLATGLHRKYYADMPRQEFDAKIGLGAAAAVADPTPEQGARPSLIERAGIHAREGLYEDGSSTGRVVADLEGGGVARRDADASFRELDRRNYGGDFPSDFEVRRDTRPVVSPARALEIRNTPDAALLEEATASQAQADAEAAAFAERRRREVAEYEAMPDAGSVADVAAVVAGRLAGSAIAPENLLPTGRASTALRTLGQGAAVNAGVSAIVEPGAQRAQMESGSRETYSFEEGLVNTLIGGVTGGVLNVAPEALGALRRLFARRQNVEPDAVAPPSIDEIAEAAEADPEIARVLEASGLTKESPAYAAAVERVQQRRAQEAVRAEEGAQPLTTTSEATAQAKAEAEATRKAQLSAKNAPSELTPEQLAEARAAGEQPNPPRAPEAIEAGPPVRTGGEAPEATTARAADAPPDPGLDAGVARARGDDIVARIGEDPEALVLDQLGIPAETYRTLPAQARERVVAAAQRQRTAEAPAPARATSDAAVGDAPYSPPTRPQARAGEAGRGRQPTDTEIEAGGAPYARTATGTADRPTRLEEDSSGLNFADRDPETGRPRDERAAATEDRANARASDARQATVDDLLREWEQRQRQRGADGERGYSADDARTRYEGAKKGSFSPKAGEPDADGRFTTDEFGFVASDKGGPVKFKDQRQAARWVLDQGHKRSPDQIFEVENHPSGDGFTVRERGRSESNTNAGGQDGRAPGQADADAAGGSGRSAAIPARDAGQTGRDAAGGSRDAPKADAGNGDRAARKERSVTLNSGVDPAEWPDPQTRTAAFRRWFGDSKVVDENGDPLTVYHGTQSDVEAFDLSKAGSGTGDFEDSRVGVFFTDNPTAANVFARGMGRARRGGNVMPVNLWISRPLEVDFGGAKYTDTELFRKIGRELGQTFNAFRDGAGIAARDALRDAGYDGIVIRNSKFGQQTGVSARDTGGQVGDNTTWIAFRPEQIKSATGNRGTFDRNNPNILYSGVDPTLVWEKLGKPLTRLIGREVKAAASDTVAVRRLLKASTSNSSPIRALSNVAGYIANSNRGQMFMLRDRYSGEAKRIMGEVIDKIATDPGSGRKVGQIYEEAVNQKTFNLMSRMGNIVGKEKLGDLEFATEVGDILAGRVKRGSEAAQTVARRLRGILDEVHKYAQDAGLELGYTKDYFPRMLDGDAIRKDGAGFEADAIKLYRKMGLSEKDARQAALDWRERELGVGAQRFGQQGPLSDFTKGRKLPPEADQMMAKWYNRDAFETLSTYYRNVARKAEFTRRFGKNGADLDKAFDDMIRAGVDPADLAYLRTAIDSSLGLMNGNGLSPVGSAVAWVQTVGILRMLPRAVWSSIAEPFAYGVRTGNALDGLKAFIGTWEEIFRGKSLDDHRDAAEFMGIVGDAMTHMVLAGQFGGGQASRLNNALLARFFTRSGLQPLTEAQRLTGVKIGHDLVARLVRDAGGDGRRTASAKSLLADLGIGEDDIADMAKFLGKTEGRAPKVAGLMGDSPAARQYMAAIQRFVDESIQNPKAVDRPALANHPIGRLAYGIMSFMYAYSRNVTYRVGKQAYRAASEKGLTAADRAVLAVGPGVALAVLAGMQTGMARLRDQLTNQDEAEERPEELSIIQYASRAGAFGNLDPIVNTILGAKYERDLTGIVAGPYVGQYLQDGQKLVGLIPEPIGKNSPNTNSAEWNASRAAYNAVAVPSIAAALALAPGGPVLNKAYGALIASPFGPVGGPATAPLSPQAASDFATWLSGERVRRWSGGKDPESRATGRGSTGRATGGRTTGRD